MKSKIIQNMVNNLINIPSWVNYLSEFPEFDTLLDPGKVIVDKEICGCGATEYYLRHPTLPVVLLSPRKLLIETKMDNNPTDEELLSGRFSPHHRHHKVWYFDRSKSKPIQESLDELAWYLSNPLALSNFVPKILVTYDSFSQVQQVLNGFGWLPSFTIVVDEFTALFTDVRLKGTKELNVISQLDTLPNHIVYLSATPLKRDYLDAIPAFNGIPYYELQWDAARLQKVRVATSPMKSSVSKIAEIISDFRQRGYFKSTIINGQEVFSTEAVFYVNSVSDIVRVINKCGLTPADTLVLCADEPKNRERLRKVGFIVGKPASIHRYKRDNKPITLVTRVCFEGADMYSDCSTTYVFSDANQENLNLDISIDLPQIAGRCRSENPFKNEIRLYYKLSDERLINEGRNKIIERENNTREMLQEFANVISSKSLNMIIAAQKNLRYSTCYLDVEEDPNTGKGRVVMNELARQADIRALDIKENQYRSGYTVNYYTQSLHLPQAEDLIIEGLWRDFTSATNFYDRMKLYVECAAANPHLLPRIEAEITEIPAEYKNYYRLLGPDTIRAHSYKQAELERLLTSQANEIKNMTAIQNRLHELLLPGYYATPTIKQALSIVYAEANILKTPKATDITAYIKAERCKFTDKNHQRKNGYRIL